MMMTVKGHYQLIHDRPSGWFPRSQARLWWAVGNSARLPDFTHIPFLKLQPDFQVGKWKKARVPGMCCTAGMLGLETAGSAPTAKAGLTASFPGPVEVRPLKHSGNSDFPRGLTFTVNTVASGDFLWGTAQQFFSSAFLNHFITP